MAVKKKTVGAELSEDWLIPENEQPYPVPDNWIWVRVGVLANVVKGVSYEKSQASDTARDGKILVLRGGNIQHGCIVDADNVYVPDKYVSDAQKLKKGDVVVVVSSGSKNLVGKAAQVQKDSDNVSFGAFLSLLRPSPKLDSRYFGLYFQSQEYRQAVRDYCTGININNIRRAHLGLLKFPLPPLTEQRRIAARAQSLLDEIKKAGRLLDEAGAEVKNQRTAVLFQAFRGDLTKIWRRANSDVEQASVLLAGGPGIKPVAVGNAPFEIPENWSWVRLGNLASKVVGGAHRTPKYVTTGIPFISVRNIRDNQISFADTKYISAAEHRELSKRCQPEKGDILITKSGTIGRTAVVDTDREFSLFVSVALIKMSGVPVNPRYTEFALEFLIGQQTGQNLVKGSAIKNLHLDQLVNLPLPVAPLPEQNVCHQLWINLRQHSKL